MSCDVGKGTFSSLSITTYVIAYSPTLLSLYLRHRSLSNPSIASPTLQCSLSNQSVTSPTSQLILNPFCPFTYVTAHSPTLPLLHLRHSSFSNPFASPTSQFSFSNLSVTSPTSQLILQPFCPFTYVRAHSPTLPLLHLCQSSFSNPSIALPTSEHILQPFHHFTYVRAHSPTLPLLYIRHSSFSTPSFASLTSQVLHLIHLASCQ